METVKIEYCKEKDYYYFNLPNTVCSELGWGIGDIIDWKDNEDGSFTLSKINQNTYTTGGTTTIIDYKA